MEAAPVGQSRRAERKSMRFHRKCQPGVTFWRLQPPESERRGGGGQEIRGGWGRKERRDQDEKDGEELKGGEETLESEADKRQRGRGGTWKQWKWKNKNRRKGRKRKYSHVSSRNWMIWNVSNWIFIDILCLFTSRFAISFTVVHIYFHLILYSKHFVNRSAKCTIKRSESISVNANPLLGFSPDKDGGCESTNIAVNVIWRGRCTISDVGRPLDYRSLSVSDNKSTLWCQAAASPPAAGRGSPGPPVLSGNHFRDGGKKRGGRERRGDLYCLPPRCLKPASVGPGGRQRQRDGGIQTPALGGCERFSFLRSKCVFLFSLLISRDL